MQRDLSQEHQPGTVDDAPVYDVPHAASYSTPPTPQHIVRPDMVYAFDAEARQVFLEELAVCGRLHRAAAIAGVRRQTISMHRKSDPEFEEQCQEALEAYRDLVRSTIQRRALEGDLVPIVGRVGRDRDGIIGYQRRYSDSLLVMEAKRIDPEYRDKSTVDVNVRAGVLVIGPSTSTADWASQHGGQRLPADPLEGLPGITSQLIEGLASKVHDEGKDDEPLS